MIQTGTDATYIAAGTLLDNTGGILASNGTTTLAVGDFNNRGGTLQASGAAADLGIDAGGQIDNSAQNGVAGSLGASGNVTVTANGLANTQGQITAGQALSVSTTQTLTNTQGLLAANRQVNVSAGQIDNTQGTIGSMQSQTNVTATAGALDNTAGRIEAALAINISSIGLTNTDGVITGSSLGLNSQGQTLDNTRGALAATGANDDGALGIQSGALYNDAGLIQAQGALGVDTHGQTLSNTNSGGGGILGQGSVTLTTGDLTNSAGYIGSGGALTANGAALGNTQGGLIASAAQLNLSGSALDNQGGQIQALGNLGINLSGTLDNTASLVRSGQTLGITAGSIANSDTQGDNQGLEGQSVNLSAPQIDNLSGAIRADDTLTLTSGGAIDNTQGLISSATTATLQDADLAAKTLAITNTGGTLIAGQNLAVDSASLTGDGKVLSQGDLSVRLTQNYTHTGQLQANGTASLETTGTLTNQSSLLAGTALNLKAATIDNQANGQISANQVHLQATDSHTLTNRGLIDGQDTIIETITLNNLGTGRIYGDHLAIGATTVTNDVENGVAPVIAARNRLDIGAETINNREHALIFSAGDMAIGGSLDANNNATGQAATFNNNSATIEALGNVDLAAGQINNTNEHFSTTVESLGTEHVVEYQGSGSATRYTPGTPGVYVYNDESDHLMTPEGSYESWLAYSYDRATTETKVQSSDPAQILSGGAMNITADTLLNDKSRIIAGGTLSGAIGTLDNTEVAGERTITDSGTVTSYWRNHQKGRDDTGSSTSGYNPATTIQAIALTPTVYEQNTAPAGTGTQISTLSTGTVGQSPSGANAANVAIGSGSAIGPITQVAALHSDNAGGPATVVRSGGINAGVPDNSLFSLNPAPHAGYLVETDPSFANYRNWLSSDYLLNALSIDPATTQERLGDGFYEQKLVREQVALLTGRRFLDGYAGDEAEYRGLMDAGVTYAKAHQLVPGVALSAAQMAELTSDIVWLVAKDVTLPNGQTTQVLVPQLYVRVQDGDLAASGALIGGDSVNLNVTGDLANSGTIAGRNVVALTAENLNNLGGRISGNDVAVAARTDLNNLGGRIEAANGLTASAGGDLNVTSTTRTQSNAQGSRTNVDRVAGLYVTGGGTLIAAAGRDLNLTAAAIANSGQGGSTIVAAGHDLNLGTVTEASNNRVAWDGENHRSDSSRTDVGSTIQTQGDILLQAGNDLNAKAAGVISDQGTLLATAGRDVNLNAGEANVSVDEAHQHEGTSSLFSTTTTTTRDTLDQTTAQATTLSANTATVLANRDINLKGSNVVSTQGTLLSAQNNVNIEAATDTSAESHFKDEQTSGMFSSGGIGFTIGTQEQSADNQATGTRAAASTVGSTQGDVAIQAGKNYRQVGSDVLAPQGNIDIHAKRVDILEAQNTSQSSTETKFKQSGLTVAITSPVISAVQTAKQMANAASQTKDKRMQVLAAGTTALAAKNGYDAVAADPKAAGGIGVSITIGGSKSESKQTQAGSTDQGSTVAAGGNVNLSATGASKDSDITVQGSTVQAGNDATLKADGDINLLAAKNTDEQHSTNSSQSAGVGVAITYGSGGFAAGFTANASAARGKADGQDTSWTNTHVEAGNKLALQSGGDTTLKGAVASGKQVQADVGGNLNIESLQDTNDYKSKDQSLGGSVTIGYGFAASANASQQKIDSTFASVTEQSGIKAGEDGFQVKVKGNTDLKGAVIASTDQAVQDGKNSLSTGTLTASDIENKAESNASSIGIGGGFSRGSSMIPLGGGNNIAAGGVGTDQQGNAQTGANQTPGSTLPSLNGWSATPPLAMNAGGNAHSTTKSGISGATVTITDDQRQQELTGKDVATTVAGINTDVSSDQDSSNALKPIFNEQEIKAGFEITGAFTQQVGTFLGNRAKEADAAKAALNNAKQQGADQATLDRLQAQVDEAALWGPGGTYRQIATALTSAASGDVTGSASQFIRNATVAYLQSLGTDQVKQIADDLGSESARASLQALVGCAGAAASQQSCGAGATGAAASVVVNNLIEGLTGEEAGKLSAQQKEAQKNLVTGLIASVATLSGSGNVTTTTNAAQIEMENNYLTPQQAKNKQQELAAAQTQKSKDAINAKYQKLDEAQHQAAVDCLLHGNCQSVMDPLTLQGVLNDLINACSPPRLCSPDEQRSITELKDLFNTNDNAISPVYPLEEFVLGGKGIDKLAGLVGSGIKTVAARMFGDAADAMVAKGGTEIENAILGRVRAGSATKMDPQHLFPDMVDNYVGDAAKFSIPTKGTGGAVVRQSELYQVEGGLNDKQGVFEWIVDQGQVTHRRFIPNGWVTGFPNQIPPKP